MIVKSEDIAPKAGDNFAVASFSYWSPVLHPKGAIIMTPGSDGDGRWWIKEDRWQAFATIHGLALVGCYFRDKCPSWIETYVDVKGGSGEALLEALRRFGLGTTPLYLWGFSAGGEFNYEFACWHAPKEPKRIKAFVLNKGGVYYTLLAPQEARDIPAILFSGSRDHQFRQQVIHAIYILNSMAGSRWTEHIEATAHTLHRSEKLSMNLFAQALAASEGAPHG